MEKNTYPYDPDMVKASTEFGKKIGALAIENLLEGMSSQRIRNICVINDIPCRDLNPVFVYNWIFQGVADVLRDPEVHKEISQMILDAKKLGEI
jgi:hypothetical protein